MSRRTKLCILALGITCAAAIADTLTGEARGTVYDVAGRIPILEASRTLSNVDRGWSKNLASDGDGNVAFLQLEPGNYTVKAEKEGYYPAERTNILIRLNQPKVVIPPF